MRRAVLTRIRAGGVALGVGLLMASTTVLAGAYQDFFDALRRDDAPTVVGLLQRGFDPNAVDPQGTPALIIAVRDRAHRVGQALIAQPQLDVDRRNALDETALMVAALQGDLASVRALVQRGAQINRPGWTPLHYAATGGHADVVKFLLDESAYIDAESPNGTTPLMMAARQKQVTVLRQLIDEGADPTLRNQAGLDAADYLERWGERDAAEFVRSQADAFRRRHAQTANAARSPSRPPGDAGAAPVEPSPTPAPAAGESSGAPVDASDKPAAAKRLPGERPAAEK